MEKFKVKLRGEEKKIERGRKARGGGEVQKLKERRIFQTKLRKGRTENGRTFSSEKKNKDKWRRSAEIQITRNIPN